MIKDVAVDGGTGVHSKRNNHNLRPAGFFALIASGMLALVSPAFTFNFTPNPDFFPHYALDRTR